MNDSSAGRGWDSRFVAGATMIICAVLTGCRSKTDTAEPPPVEIPPLEYQTRQFIGSALSGPSLAGTLPPDLTPADALAVRCTLTYYETLPYLDLPPLGTEARMIGAMRGDQAILPNPILTTTVQYVHEENAGEVLSRLEKLAGDRSVLVNEFEGALFQGACVVLVGQSLTGMPTSLEGEAHRRVAFTLSRDADDQLDFAVIIDQVALPPARKAVGDDIDPYQAEYAQFILQREFIVLDTPPTVGGGPVALLVPSPLPGFEGGGFAAVLRIDPAPTDGPETVEHGAIVERCIAAIAVERAAALEAARRLQDSELEVRQVGEALRSLQLDRLHRRTLVFLTTTTGAHLAEDLALIIDEETLRLFAEAIVTGAEQSDAPLDEEGGLGWILERGAYTFLVERSSDETISPSELGLLLKHTGQAGQFPSVIEDALLVAHTSDEFHDRIIEENRIFLEDHNISARVRAFDWLAAQQLEPADYDPLGEAPARRAALTADHALRVELERARRALEAEQ